MTMDDDDFELQINVDDFEQVNVELCRCCLSGSDPLNEIFRCVKLDGELLPISNVYRNVTDLSLAQDDGLPQNVCVTCETHLIEAFLFKRTCRHSLNTVRGLSNAADDKPMLESSDTELEVIVEELDELEEHESEQHFVEIDEVGSESSISAPEEGQNDEHLGDGVAVSDEVADDSNQQMHEANNTDNVDSTPANVDAAPLEDQPIDKTCDYCNERFSSLLVFNAHIERHRTLRTLLISSSELYRCVQCFTIFHELECFQQHINNEDSCCERDHKFGAEFCDVDDEWSRTDDHIQIHLPSAHIEDDGRRRCGCDLCPRTFDSVAAFCEHFSSAHSDASAMSAGYMQAERPHACDACGAVGRTLYDTLEHVYFHQADYACLHSECSERFKGFTPLYEHLIAAHAAQLFAEQKVCVYCLHVVRDVTELYEHKRSLCHKRNLQCRYCDKKFFRRSTMFMHERTHNTKTYICKVCGKGFLQNHDVKNHMRVHTKERPYKCRQCDKTFKTVGQRNGHEATHVSANKYECPVCQKAMKSERILREHMKTHASRRFSCDICQRKFGRRYHLTTHMKSHHGK